MATANSNVSNANWVEMISILFGNELIPPWFPNKVSKRCPAIMLADSRIDSVMGRIILLMVSIRTIKDIRRRGVLLGNKCANILLVLFTHPNSIKVSHSGRAILREIAIWLVAVKIKGNSPFKLLVIISHIRAITKIVNPCVIVGFSRDPNSLWRYVSSPLISKLLRVGVTQKIRGIKNIGIRALTQFIARFWEVIGSNEEKRLVIILSCC